MATTFAEALGKIGVTIPDHLIADAEVPVLTGVQAQGDLIIVPAHLDDFKATVVLESVRRRAFRLWWVRRLATRTGCTAGSSRLV